MIIKGQARGRARQLAAHLLRSDQNEAVQLLECRGTIAREVTSALIEMEAQASAVASKRPLYHASISPEPRKPLTPVQVRTAVDLLEHKLGLASQPRVVILHRKAGREHIHVVWSRIDTERGRVIPDSWNYRRHEEVARELEILFGHAPVQGGNARRPRGPRSRRVLNSYELRQEERSGVTAAQVGTTLGTLWRSAGNGKEFRRKLAEAGFTLARGDRRVFVVIDPAGEVHSLSRRLGVASGAVRVRLDDLELSELPSVADTRHSIRTRQKQLTLKTAFAPVAREITARPLSRGRIIKSIDQPAFAEAVFAKQATEDAPVHYRTTRAIIVADFAARIAEALRSAPRERLAAILAVLKQERRAALAALTSDHAAQVKRCRSERRVVNRKPQRSRYAVHWTPSPVSKRLRRSVRP